MGTIAKASPGAAHLLADLLDLPPVLRNALLIDMPPAEYAHVTGAAHDLLGTPFGLWQDDPAGFINLGLGESTYNIQDEIGRSIVENERTVVPSCHSSGKSWYAARLVIWFIMTHPVGTAKVVTTAPKFDQLEQGLWPDIRDVHSRAKLPGRCLLTEWKMGDVEKPVAFGRSPKDTDETGFSGIHAPYVMAIVEEAGGFSPILGVSLENLASGGYFRLALFGNPPIDEAATAYLEEKSAKPSYHVIPIPAAKTPNFTGEKTPQCMVHPDLDDHPISDHLISRKWVADVVADFGTDDPYYIARVDAQFPKDLQAKIIPYTWLEHSRDNKNPEPSTWVRLGVDVASDGGDEFVIAMAEGNNITIIDKARGSSLSEIFDVAARILTGIEIAEERRRLNGSTRKVRVKIDADGLGWGAAGALVAWKSEGRHNAEIVRVRHGTSCESREGAEKFANKRAEMWWNGRLMAQPRRNDEDEQIEPTWAFPGIEESTLRQLSAPMRSSTSSGKFLAEPKPKMKARGLSSPDRADAILLSVYEPNGSGRGRLSLPSGRVPRAGG